MDILPDNKALGIAVTIILAVIGAAWSLASKIGRLQRAVEEGIDAAVGQYRSDLRIRPRVLRFARHREVAARC